MVWESCPGARDALAVGTRCRSDRVNQHEQNGDGLGPERDVNLGLEAAYSSSGSAQHGLSRPGSSDETTQFQRRFRHSIR